MILTGVVGVSAANTLTSNGVLYSNAGSSVTTVEGALNELYANYNSLLAKGNASASDILSGKTALVKGNEVTGTMRDNSSLIQTATTDGTDDKISAYHVADDVIKIAPAKGYWGTYWYDGSRIEIPISGVTSAIGLTANKIAKGQTIAGVTGTYTSDATATASQILSGQTAYVNGSKITGTMRNASVKQSGEAGLNSNYSGIPVIYGSNPQLNTSTDGTKIFSISPAPGYYSTANSYTSITQANLANAIGLTPDKIEAGQTIAGVTGTHTAQNHTYGIKFHNFHQLGGGQTCSFSHSFTPTVKGKLIVFMTATRNSSGVSSAWSTRSVNIGGTSIAADLNVADDWQGRAYWVKNVNANSPISISTSISGTGTSLTSCSLFVLYVE